MLRIVLGDVTGAAAASGVVVRLEGRSDEVFGGGEAFATRFGDVTCASDWSVTEALLQ